MPEVISIDCRGLACPQPVIKVKKALDSISEGSVIAVVDNDTARENVSLFAKNAGYEASVEKVEGDYRITITKGAPGAVEKVPAAQAEGKGRSAGVVYFMTTNLLGQGSPDLGQVLMKSLMVTLNEMNPPPAALLFLNSGVMSPCEGSPVLELLQTLSGKGVTIVSCGTCLEYYKLKDKLKVGRIGNMLEINSYLSEEAKVITIA
ncbi:MAG: sulfurtransferase-like selenium metabolism protein YedF [Bacillota bacterium]